MLTKDKPKGKKPVQMKYLRAETIEVFDQVAKSRRWSFATAADEAAKLLRKRESELFSPN